MNNSVNAEPERESSKEMYRGEGEREIYIQAHGTNEEKGNGCFCYCQAKPIPRISCNLQMSDEIG